MMEIKWMIVAAVSDRRASIGDRRYHDIAALWNESRVKQREAGCHLPEGLLCPATRPEGPPGGNRGTLAVLLMILNIFDLTLNHRLGRLLSFRRRRTFLSPSREGCSYLWQVSRMAFAIIMLSSASVYGQESSDSKQSEPQRWNFHLQSTALGQTHPSFPAEYTGTNSLNPRDEIKETVSFDATGGVRLWKGAELFGDVLIWQGFGLSKTLGVAGFPNGEAFRIGKSAPDAAVCRAFLRQTFGLGGGKESVEEGPTDLRGTRDVRRLVLTIGHLSAKDIFDNNAYANDPRSQFMNWALYANTAWDYPANVLGFTNGVALEFYTRNWTGRAGIFMVSKVANGERLNWNLAEAWSAVAELERKHALRGHPGTIRFLGYDMRANMGNYQQTLNDPSLGMDIALTAAYRNKYGFGINAEQEIRKNLGAFIRLGWTPGKNQTYEFTDVDRTASVGISLKGAKWRRQQDTVGVAVVVNGISSVHRQYLAAGGLGITVGDGALNYRTERLLEMYYNWRISKHFELSPDYQFAWNPAYNRARGPANIFALRLHTEY